MTETLSPAARIAEFAIYNGAAQKVGELAELVRLVGSLEPEVVLEIGSMTGGTLRAWKAAAPEATLISVSQSHGPYGGGMVEPGITDNHIDTDSHSPATLSHVLEILGDRQVDFLFIDADHSYEGVRQDFAMYGWLVRKGGVVAFHDILAHEDDASIGVDLFWAQLRSRYETSEFTESHLLRDGKPWGGIGVVYL